MPRGNFRLVTENHIDSMTLMAVPDAVASLPVDNVRNAWRERVMRSVKYVDEPVITQLVEGDCGEVAKVADCFSIHAHNLTGSDVYRVELFDGPNQSGSVVYDSSEQSAAVLIPLGIWVCGVDAFGAVYSDDLDKINTVWFDPVVFRSFRLTIISYANPKGYIQLGMIFLGNSVRFDNNFAWGNDLGWKDGLLMTRTEAGSLVTESKNRKSHRELRLSLDNMSDTDRNILAGKTRKSSGKAVLVAAYPIEASDIRRTEYTLIAKIAPGTRFSHVEVGQHATELTFLEI